MPTPNAIEIYGPTIEAAPVLLESGRSFSRSETGFDKLSLKMWGFTANPTNYATTQFPAGGSATSLGYANMFCSSVNISQVSNQVYTFDVEYVGLIGTQPIKRTISSKSQSYTTGSITIPGSPPVTVEQAQGQYINLSCQFNYVTVSMPATDATPVPPGGAGSLPAYPANPFTSITTPIYNYPSGWIREGLDVDMVNGTDRATSIFLVKENWVYVYPVMPG